MPDKKNKKIYTRLALHLTPPCWFTWILSNLQPRFGTAGTADENYVITTAIFSTTSKFAQRHFLDCKPTLCPTEEGKKKKNRHAIGNCAKYWSDLRRPQICGIKLMLYNLAVNVS